MLENASVMPDTIAVFAELLAVGEGVGVLLSMHEMSPFPASCAVPLCAQQRHAAPGQSSHRQQPTLGSAFFLALHFVMPSAHELTEVEVVVFQKSKGVPEHVLLKSDVAFAGLAVLHIVAA